MRAFFWSLLALSLAVVVFAEMPAQAAPADGKGQKSDADEALDPNDLFPLAKQNGVTVRVVQETSPDKMIKRNYFIPSFVGGKKELKKVVSHPENATGIQLAVAADMNYRAGNLPEAAFLFYVARLRLEQDFEKYPPKDDAVRSNMFFSMVLDAVKNDLMQDLYVQPKALGEVVKRIETFEPKEPAGYNPGWEHTRHDVPADFFAKNKAILLGEMKPVSELLLVPDYFLAFRVYRESYALTEEEQALPAVLEGRTRATNAMKRIEKEKNLHGFMFQVEHKPVD
jgi:hypothetical protein